MADVAVLAESGTLSGWDQERADAWVLGMQDLATGPDIVELVASTDTSLVEFFSDLKINLFWGWCWRYQARGASDEYVSGAVSTNYRARDTTSVFYRYESTDVITQLAMLSISWAAERPTGNLTLGPEHLYYMGDQIGSSVPTNRLLFVVNNQTQIRWKLSNTSTDSIWDMTDPPHHVLSWYDETGARKDIAWNPSSLGPYSDGDPITTTTVVPSGSGYDPNGAWGFAYFPIYTFAPYSITHYEGEKLIGAWERGYYSVDGIRLDRKIVGQRERYSVDLSISGGPYPAPFPTSIRHQYEFESQLTSYPYEFCVLSDVPGVVWLVAEDETIVYSKHDCSESGSVSKLEGGSDTDAGKNWYVSDIDPCVNDPYINGTVPVQGLAIVNNGTYELPEAISDAMITVIKTTHPVNQTKTLAMPAADGYYDHSNIKGCDLPDGLDADGAALAGRWIGAA
jgi:hypothetical protein